MTTIERKVFLDTLVARADLLVKTCQADMGGVAHQDFLIAQQIQALVLATVGACRKELALAFWDWTLEKVMADHGLCGMCGGRVGSPAFMCQSCERVGDQMMADLGLSAGDFQAKSAGEEG